MLFLEQTLNKRPGAVKESILQQTRCLHYGRHDIFTFISECGSTVYYYLTDSSYHQNDIFASISVSLSMTYLSC